MNEQQVFEAVFKATGVSNFEKAIAGAQKSIKSFENVSEKLKDTGKTLTKAVTLPLVGLGAAAVKLGADYDDQMSTVQAVTSASADEIERLSNLARDMGKNTRYSASEAATAQENLARAGFTTGEIMDALGSTLNLATSGALSLDEASGIAARAIRGFGLEASEAGRVSDVLAYTAAATNTTVGGLGETFKYVAPTAAGLGIEMEEVAAAAGLMGDAGIDAGQAGNMLRRGLLNLASPTAQQADLLNELGLEMFDAEGNMKPLVDVVGELEKGLDGMTAQQQTAALSTLFGAQAVSGWTAVVNEGSDSLADLTGRIRESDGYAQGFAETAEDNLAGSFRSMRSSLEEAMLIIYEFGQGPIRDLVDRLTGLIDKFSEMDPAMQQIIIIVGILAAATGPLLMLIGQMGLGISALGTFFVGTAGGASVFATILGALASPITLIIAGIAALVAVMVYLYKTNETVREAINTAWQFIKDLIMQAVAVISGYVQSVIGGLVTWWQENNQMILEAAQNVWGAIQTVIEVAMNIISSIMQTVWPMIMAVVKFAWDGIKNIIDGTIKVITGIIEFFSALFTGNWSAMWDAVKQIVSGAVQAIWGFIQLWIVGKIIGAIKLFAGMMKSLFSGAWAFVKNIFSSSLSWIGGNVSSGLGAVKGIFTTILNALKGIVTGAFNGVRTAFSSGMSNALSTVTGFLSKFTAAGANIVGNIAKGITGAIGKVTGAVTGVLKAARNLLPFSPPKDKSSPMAGLEKNGIVENIAQGIMKNEGEIQRAMNRALDVDMPMVNGRVSHSVNMNTGRTENLLEQLVNSNQVIVLDSGELVGATYPQYDRVGGSQTQLTERWGR